MSKDTAKLKSMLIGADFLIKKLAMRLDLGIGMEEQIGQFQNDMKPIIKEFEKLRDSKG